MKLQGNKMMKTNFKRLAILTMVGAATVGLTACGGGGGSSDGQPANLQASLIKINLSTQAITLSNTGGSATGTLSISSPSSGTFLIYDGTSDQSWCTPTKCPSSCQSMQTLAAGASCKIYINAQNIIDYNQDPVTVNNALVVTDLSDAKTYSYTLKNTGVIYAVTATNNIYYQAKTDAWWSVDFAKPTTESQIYGFAIDHNGIAYIGGASKLYRINDVFHTNWDDLGTVSSSITGVNAIAFDANNNVYSGGENSDKYYTFSNGAWSEHAITGMPSFSSITDIGFSSTDTMVVAAKDVTTPHIFMKPVAVNWLDVGLPSVAATAVYGFSVANDGTIYITVDSTNKYYSNSGSSQASWVDNGNVQFGTKPVYALNVDSTGIVYAGIGNNGEINKKVAGDPNWGTLVSPEIGAAVTHLANGSLLTITKE
jgi:hypothetical protein